MDTTKSHQGEGYFHTMGNGNFLALTPLFDPLTKALWQTAKAVCYSDELIVDSIEGPDQREVLQNWTGLYDRFGISYKSVSGRRNQQMQVTQFEIENTLHHRKAVREMHEYLRSKPGLFRPVPPAGFGQIANLKISFLQDDRSLLLQPAMYLARNKINLRTVRATKDDVLGGLRGIPEVVAFAELEAPSAVNLKQVEAELPQFCQKGAEVQVQPIWNSKQGVLRGADTPYVVAL